MKLKNDNAIHLSVVALGVSSVISQLIFIRELLIVFYSNELIIGMILACWMLLTATGAYLGSRFQSKKSFAGKIIIVQGIAGILPLATVLLLRIFRDRFFLTGVMLSTHQALLTSFVVLLPYCLLSGMLFVLFCLHFSDREFPITKIYILDSAGSIVGGLLYNFILLFCLSTFQNLLIIAGLNLVLAFFLSVIYEKKHLIPGILLIISLLVISLFFNLDNLSRSRQFKGQSIIFERETPEGNVVVTNTDGQLNFFENGSLTASGQDIQNTEEAVHYAMVQHSEPVNVLLLSGSLAGLTNEVLKYNTRRIIALELNPFIFEVAKKYTSNLSNGRIECNPTDARLYIKTSDLKFDAAIINIPEPSTARTNRFYTSEFFQDLKKRMNPGAVLLSELPSTSDYLSPEAMEVNSKIFVTLKGSFRNVMLFPGGKNYYVSSDGNLSREIGRLIDERRINTTYVNKYYLDEASMQERADKITKNLKTGARLNSDYKPVVYFHQLAYLLSYFDNNYTLILISVLLLLVIFLLRLKPVTFALFTGGIAASGLEIVLLLAFQVIYGYIFRIVGIIVTTFMVGLAAGSWLASVRNKKQAKYSGNYKTFTVVQILTGIFAMLVPLLLIGINGLNVSSWLIILFFILLTGIISSLTGFQFALSTSIQRLSVGKNAASLYGADLIGSAVGALVVPAFLIPLLGFTNACIIIGGLNLISGIILVMKK